MVAVLIAPVARKPVKLPEYRCSCGRLLVRGDLRPGTRLEAYCDRCKRHVLIVVSETGEVVS